MFGAMDDDELAALIEREIVSARDYSIEGEIGHQRVMALDYYYGRPFGNEEEGRSEVVSSDVSESIDWLLPAVMEVFCSGDTVVEFSPRNANDVQAAEQATDLGNYVFMSQNNSFLNLYESIKDGMLCKTGALIWYWDERISVTEESYQGLTDDEFTQLVNDDTVSVISHKERTEDSVDPMLAQMAGINPASVQTTVQDVTIRRQKKKNQVRIRSIPPEELLISQRARTLDVDEIPFIGWHSRRTRSDLVAMGYDRDLVDEMSNDTNGYNSEVLASARRVNSMIRFDDAPQEAQEEVWYTEAFWRVDYDGDGITELRRVCYAGGKILRNEVVDHVQIAWWSPKLMPHEPIGVSTADDTMDLQLQKSVLWRQMFDNIYLSNAPRYGAVTGQVDLDDLMTVRPGGVVRLKTPEALTPIQTPFTAGQTFPMVQYIDEVRRYRTGTMDTTLFDGEDGLQRTATEAREASSLSQKQIKLVARTYAEMVLVPCFKGIMKLLRKYHQEPMVIRLRDRFVDVDPSSFADDRDMTVNVGLGSGTKFDQIQTLQMIAAAQKEAVMGGGLGLLVKPKNIYNLQSKIAVLAGFKDPTQFWSDPDQVPPAPPGPPKVDPVVQAAQINAQALLQAEQIKDARERYKIEVDAQTQIAIATLEEETKRLVAASKIDADRKTQLMDLGKEALLKAADMESQNQQNAHEAGVASMEHLHDANMSRMSHMQQESSKENDRNFARDQGNLGQFSAGTDDQG